MKKVTRLAVLSFAALVAFTGTAHADRNNIQYEVTVTNITRGQVFSPPALVIHNRNIALFEVGAPALPELAIVAEDGATQPLVDLVNTLPDVINAEGTSAPLPPGASAVYAIEGSRAGRGSWRRNDVISIVSMLVNTNDAFFALDSETLPRFRGASRTFYVGAFDAGSEANNEDCAFIPGPACPADSGNARSTEDAEGFVYISNGIHGIGDLGPAVYDWRNPVAKITVTRTR